MNKRVLVDVDGVLLNWVDPFHAWMLDQGYTLSHPEEYDMARAYNIGPGEARDCIAEFGQFTRTPFHAYSDAMTWVPRLHFKDKYTFVAITVYSKANRFDRAHNLRTEFGFEFEDIICVNRHSDKKEVLADLATKSDWWIEDRWSNAELGAQLGIPTILRTRPWNAQWTIPDGVTRCDNWREIYTLIKNHEKQ